MRREHDSLGEREVPQNVYYGIHSLRAIENFPISGRPVHPEWVKALAEVKLASARANTELKAVPEDVGKALQQAAEEVAGGALIDQFVVDALQGGAGTSFNMNMNEVLANRALELLGEPRGTYSRVHPNDHVNRCQSTNDTVPTALRIVVIRKIQGLTQALADLHSALQAKATEFDSIMKLGRTEMQDAVPMTLGQEFGAWAAAIARDQVRIQNLVDSLRHVNLGGTAIGTGVGAEDKYPSLAVDHLSQITGLDLHLADDLVDATQNTDVLPEVSGQLKACAVNLAKISADMRLLSSGPRGGFGEIQLPARQAGSSIMPGKINPVIPEMIAQVAYRVMASDLAVTLGAQAGQLELNAFIPMMGDSLLEALDILTAGATIMRTHCVEGIAANSDRCRQNLDCSTAAAAALITKIGYEAATKLVQDQLKKKQ